MIYYLNVALIWVALSGCTPTSPSRAVEQVDTIPRGDVEAM